MRAITYKQGDTERSHAFVTAERRVNCIYLTVTSADFCENVAHLHLNPSEARRLAAMLIRNAEALDPSDL